MGETIHKMSKVPLLILPKLQTITLEIKASGIYKNGVILNPARQGRFDALQCVDLTNRVTTSKNHVRSRRFTLTTLGFL